MFLPQTLLVLGLCGVNSYKILVLLPFPGRSHSIPILTLAKALAKNGHEVTTIGYFPLESSISNYTDVNMGRFGTSFINFLDLRSFKASRHEMWLILNLVERCATTICEEEFKSGIIRDFLKMNQTFDVILAHTFNSDCYLSFMHRFQAPVVGFITLSLTQWTSEKFGNPTSPSYVANNLLDYVPPMSFLARVESFLVGVFHGLYYNYFILSKGESIARKYFGKNLILEHGKDISDEYLGKELPPFIDLSYNVSLLLVNSHFALLPPRPLVPAIVEVGGIHIGKPRRLRKDLEKWINESTHGVIYFSLGSMIKGHTFPDEKRLEFLKAFGRLPQRVLWKWENETMPGKPDNVMIQKWMPQLDILCHPNVKAFISHGGLLGTTEAVHCGVPVMVMPQYGDQFTNAKALEANGGGVILHLHEATEEKVYDALKTILEPSFKKQAEELSARFRDRPLPPLETAIYWVEYVARHRGAHHMRTAAVGMPLYKYLLLDVIAFLLLVFGLVSWLFFYVARAVLRKLFGRRDKQKGD